MNHIWDNLASHKPLRTCKCGLCTCNLGDAQEADREENKVHQFLFGLDDQLRTVRSSLVALVLIQSLEEVCNIIRQEEDMRTSAEEKQEVSAFSVQSKPRSRFDDKDKPLCKHCNKCGHSLDNVLRS